MSKREINASHLIPILITELLSILLSPFLINPRISKELSEPFLKENTPTATTYNILLFMGLIAIGSIILYITGSKKKINWLMLFYRFSIVISLFGIYQFYSIFLYNAVKLNIIYEDFIMLILLPLLLTAISYYIIYNAKKNSLSMLILIFFGVSIGLIFIDILPFWSVITIVLIMSFYDIYTVFRGPLKKLIDNISSGSGVGINPKGEELLKGVTVSYKGLHIGLGDIIFYSMLIGESYLLPRYKFVALSLVTISILTGSYITLKLLKRKRALPALPIPALISLVVILFIYFIT